MKCGRTSTTEKSEGSKFVLMSVYISIELYDIIDAFLPYLYYPALHVCIGTSVKTQKEGAMRITRTLSITLLGMIIFLTLISKVAAQTWSSTGSMKAKRVLPTATTVPIETTTQAINDLITSVQGLSSLNTGQKNSLISKLNTVSDAINRANLTTACHQLGAFINEVNAQLDQATANNLIDAAQSIKTAIECA
jgi:hypothetical protein